LKNRHSSISLLLVALSITSAWSADSKAEQARIAYRADTVPVDLTVQEKKQRFNALVLPAVQAVFTELSIRYIEIEKLIETDGGGSRLAELRAGYEAGDNAALLEAVKPHPISIAMAQAAMESAWGTSRFFREANNIFGVWSTDENEPRIAAAEKRGGKTIWVKKYYSLEAAVRDYYRTLARGRAFDEFRRLRMKSDDPHALVEKLDRYSERGAAYGRELSSMIRYNDFQEFDRQHEETEE
jgi:Bax protein